MKRTRLFVEEDGTAEEYFPERFLAWGVKFLYFSDGESELLLVGAGRIREHKTLHELFKSKNPALDMDVSVMQGAGDLNEGTVIDWSSMGFGLDTPRKLRPRILQLLGVE